MECHIIYRVSTHMTGGYIGLSVKRVVIGA